MKWTVPRQEKYPALPGFPSQPAQNCPGPVCPAYLVHTAPTLHFFIGYSYLIHFFQNGVTTVLDVDCHSMLYLFYDPYSLSLRNQKLPGASYLNIYQVQMSSYHYLSNQFFSLKENIHYFYLENNYQKLCFVSSERLQLSNYR